MRTKTDMEGRNRPKAKLKQWYTRPVFVSSTFRDMQAERDYLNKNVFPELAERLRKRFHYLETVDLRWGVDTFDKRNQEEKELLVLKLCLNEIERCRPFLIILLGDRYGWVPSEDRMKAAMQEKNFKTDVDIKGKSVTALEIEFGVLDSPKQRKRSFFYFRNPLPYAAKPLETAAQYSEEFNNRPQAKDARERLKGLKERIKSELPGQVRTYTAKWDSTENGIMESSLKEFGNMVLEDLWGALDEETKALAEKPDTTWQERERNILSQFVEERVRTFKGRKDLLDQLEELALSAPGREHWGTVITGGSGSGKSALFAKLNEQLDKYGCMVLSHVAGVSPVSSCIRDMLLRWIEELSGYLEIPEQKPETMEETKTLFANLLSRAAVDKRVVCLLDALNRFERTSAARYMTWLPEIWPENARLIVTAIPGEETRTLGKRRGFKVQELPPLNETDTRQIIESIGKQYGKTISPDVIKVIRDKRRGDQTPSYSNPLWVRIIIEELLLLDQDDFAAADQFTGNPEAQLHALLINVAEKFPPEIEEGYAYLLRRAEKSFGEVWVRAVFRFLAASRYGLREIDLRNLLERQGIKWNSLQFAALRRYIRAHLIQRGTEGYWDFTHDLARVSLEERYLADKQDRLRVHSQAVDYLETLQPEDPLRQSELMYHYYMADDKMRAARYYGGELQEEELAGATKVLAEIIIEGAGNNVNFGLDWVTGLLKQDGLDNDEIYSICERYNFDLAEIIKDYIDISARITIMDENKQALYNLTNLLPDGKIMLQVS
ncbi:DUF4062 domain-containing protein [Phosphitispora fastidiosa]|uniref:DUF4062 domain-containing protein n=1 Tax=Phosphitispora fastidiosa TaxID=2837202 RepID=UPI001E464861|nr:DUF4062 domain-containing protein [Phosphitispora fastidiosa]